jgi:chaperonin GroEL
LLRTQKALDKLGKGLEGDMKTGVDIIRRCVEEPLRMIARNAGHDGAIIVDKVRSENNVSTGFNADEEKVEDLVAAGVIDPTKVVRVAIQNASSIAGLLLTTEAIISELPEKKKAGPPMPGGGGGYEDFD